MRRHQVPGLSLALVREQKIVWAEAFGVRDKETKAALMPATAQSARWPLSGSCREPFR
jgi:CubicO group peptidase (beta-lactamase class C family)